MNDINYRIRNLIFFAHEVPELPHLCHGRMCTWPCGRLVADPLSAAWGAHGNPLSVDFGADVLFYVSIGFLLVRHVASLRGVNLTSVIALATEDSTS